MNQLYGSQPVKVIELLNQRRRVGYRPGDSDGNRIGLIVEGGSMRGAISSAALGALSQLGYRPCFDEVWGTSSGAINAAYFVSGQTNLGTTIYYEIATDPAFINIWRWPNAMDIDRLFDNLRAAGKLMDIDAIMHSGTDLYISATDVDTGSAVYFSNRDNRPEIIIPALRASACAPMFTNRTEGIDLNFYNDGMAQAALPVAGAAMRCTHLVAALTRKIGYRKQRSAILGFVEAMRLRAYSREYRRSYRSRHVLYNRALDTLFDARSSPCSLVIAPGPSDDLIGKSETRTRSLTQAIGQSRDRVEAIFAV